MHLDSSEIKNLAQDKNCKILIEKILKKNEFESTSKIYISDANGNRVGPFIQKTIKSDSGLGKIYKILATEQVKEEKFLANIYNFEDDGKNINVVQEYVEGKTLENFLSSTHTQKEILNVMISLCESVHYLHENFSLPIIHRDIKPTNIIVSDSLSVKLIDFGIARAVSEDKKLSKKITNANNLEDQKERDTKIFGTVGFAPPEQFGFAQTTQRSDIYSLGKVLELLFDNSVKQNKSWLALKKSICPKCCELDPSRRFYSVSEILGILKSANHFSQKYSKIVTTDEKIFEKIKIGTIIYNTLVIACYVWLTACAASVFIKPDSDYILEHGVGESILAFIIIAVFILTPTAFFLFKKGPLYKLFRKFPRITLKIGIIIACVCFLCIVVLVIICEWFNIIG